MNDPEIHAQLTPGPVAAVTGRFAKIGHIIRRLLGGGESYRIKETTLIIAVSVFMGLAFNTVFFTEVFALYPLSLRYLLFHLGILVIVVALTAFLFALVSSKFTTKPLVMLLLGLSSKTTLIHAEKAAHRPAPFARAGRNSSSASTRFPRCTRSSPARRPPSPRRTKSPPPWRRYAFLPASPKRSRMSCFAHSSSRAGVPNALPLRSLPRKSKPWGAR